MLKPTTVDDLNFILSKYEAVYDQAVAITPELAQKAGLLTSGVHSVQLVDGKPTFVVKPHVAFRNLTAVEPSEATLVEGHRTRFSSPGFYKEQKARYRREGKTTGIAKKRT